MQKNYVDLEMSTVNTINNDAIVSQTSSISRSNSIKRAVSQKRDNCNEACQQYGWAAGLILFTTGLIVGGGYLIKLLATE